jgi:hypothetical protein
MTIVHDFDESLRKSHEQADAPWWEEVYRQAFPTMTGMRDVRKDGHAQRGGVDRFVDLRDGTSLKIDEKVRFQVYSDIFIEYYSNLERKTPGWAVNEDLSTDFIAYAFVPSGECYLFPYQILRRCAKDHWNEWFERFGKREVPNRLPNGSSYTTVGIPVPTGVLLDAVRDAMFIKFNPE